MLLPLKSVHSWKITAIFPISRECSGVPTGAYGLDVMGKAGLRWGGRDGCAGDGDGDMKKEAANHFI